MSAGGPPPGGYGFGLIDPEKKPETKKTEEAPAPPPAPRPAVDPYSPPKVSPFGGANYGPADGGARPAQARRWVGLPIIGIGILCIRVLLLCARTSTPSYTPPYSYQPPFDLPTPSVAVPKAPTVAAGPLAASREGTDVFWFEGSTLVRRDAAKKVLRLAPPTGLSARSLASSAPIVDSLVAGGNRACWIEDRSSVHCVEDTRTMASERLLFAGSAGLADLRVDADAAYFVEESWKNSGTVYTVSRVDFRSRSRTELVSGSTAHHLVLDGANLYFVSGKVALDGKGDVAISRVAKTGGAPKVIASLGERTPESLSVQGSDLFFTAPGNVDEAYAMQLFRLAKTGGDVVKVNLGDEEVAGAFAVNDKSIYFVGSGDSLYRVARAGGTPAEVSEVTARISRLVLTSKTVEYTAVGQPTPRSAPLAD